MGNPMGFGNTVGLGQVTVGTNGYSRQYLMDPLTNISAMGTIIRGLMSRGLIDPERPLASLATRYNCGSCDTISGYGRRVESYEGMFR